jgi:hypothetical protein
VAKPKKVILIREYFLRCRIQWVAGDWLARAGCPAPKRR